jgi:hypothetical protein
MSVFSARSGPSGVNDTASVLSDSVLSASMMEVDADARSTASSFKGGAVVVSFVI